MQLAELPAFSAVPSLAADLLPLQLLTLTILLQAMLRVSISDFHPCHLGWVACMHA